MKHETRPTSPERRIKRIRLSLQWRAMLLLVVAGLVPAIVVGSTRLRLHSDLVMLAEQRRQLAVTTRASSESLRHVNGIVDDARAVAAAISFAAQNSENTDAIAGIRPLLSSRRNFDAVRFEVPAKNFSTIIAVETNHRPPPSSTPEAQHIADEQGYAFIVQPDGVGVVIVRVNPTTPKGVPGYISARTDLHALDNILKNIITDQFESSRVSLIVVDRNRHVISQHNIDELSRGSDASALLVWKMIPEGIPPTDVGVVGSFELDGEPKIANLYTVPELGWTIAVWCPTSDAYSLHKVMRRDLILACIAAIALAIAVGWFFGRTIARPILHIAKQVDYIGQRRWDKVCVELYRTDEIGLLASSIEQMADDLEKSELVIERQAQQRNDLSRFLSKELVDAIVEGRHPLSLGGKRAEVSVLFADVVAFTPLAESRPAEEVVKLLNELFSMLSEIIFRHQGMVDKFIGDCVMAVWGAAETQPDHAKRAVAAADDMMRFLETAAGTWRETFGVEVRLGVGINSGQVLVGNVGSNKRMEFTVIGDVVNVASRLETLAQPNQVLLTAQTRAAIGDAFEVASLGEHDITGHSRVEVFELC